MHVTDDPLRVGASAYCRFVSMQVFTRRGCEGPNGGRAPMGSIFAENLSKLEQRCWDHGHRLFPEVSDALNPLCIVVSLSFALRTVLR